MLVAERCDRLGAFIGGIGEGSGSDKNSSYARSCVRDLGEVRAGKMTALFGSVPWHCYDPLLVGPAPV